MADLENPLSAEQKKQLDTAIIKSGDIIKAIKRAQTAGIDTGNNLALAEDNRSKLIAIKQTYFPNG